MTNQGRAPLFDEESRHLDRFGVVLAMTVASLILLSLIDFSDESAGLGQEALAIAANGFVSVGLLFALRAAGLRRRWQRVADTLVLLGLVTTSVVVLLVGEAGAGVYGQQASAPPLLALALSVMAPAVVVRRLISHRVVEPKTLLGAVSAYLLIPVAFFYVFMTVEIMSTAPFFGQEQPTSDFMYFSLTTITTVGYGDLTAAAPIGRMFANAESLIGQLYLVTFVGLLVGLLTGKRAQAARSADASEPDATH